MSTCPPPAMQGTGYRIAHLHNSEGVYGAERWTMTQARYLANAEIDPLVITLGHKANSDLFYKELARSGIPSVHLRIGGRLNPRLIMALRSLLVKAGIEVLHTHGFKSDVMGYLATLGLPIALVSTPHGWCAAESRLIRFYEAVGRLFLRRFDKIFPLSPALLDDLLDAGFSSRKLQLILNAVDELALQPLFDQRVWRQKDDPLNVLYVGRLSEPKGVLDLIEGFSSARLQTESRLYIVGDGPQRSAMVALCNTLGIDDSVDFLGVLDDVSPAYRAGNVLILPSYSEGIPRVIMEAFAAGVPVIGTDIPGIRQLIVPGETGLLVPTGNPSAIARCLERVELNPGDSRRMALNARMLIKQRHSSREQARLFAEEYKSLIETNHRRSRLLF